jgi:hypothetical protein
MKFRDWLERRVLQEVGTGTNSVAVFSRPIFSDPLRRNKIPLVGEEDPFFRKQEDRPRHYHN